MNKNQYKKAYDFAHSNLKKLEKIMPKSVKDREASLFQKISNLKGNETTKLKRLYSEMDIIYSHLDKITACKKGCDYCCYQEIAISELEVAYIVKNTKARRIKKEICSNEFIGPCPFLKGHKCSIYNFRPFLCRRHVSITDSSKWCEANICNEFEFPLINFSEVDKSYAYLLKFGSKGHLHKNIRQVFKPLL